MDIESAFVAAMSIIGGLLLASLYGLATSAVRKRVTVRSPEAKAIEQIVPAVNALIELQGPQLDALVAILEAQKGQINGNVDSALKTTRAARAHFDTFLVHSARVQQ